MKLLRPHPPLSNPRFRRNISTTTTSTAATTAEDDHFVTILNDIVRGNQSWKIALNNTSISRKLNPHHVGTGTAPNAGRFQVSPKVLQLPRPTQQLQPLHGVVLHSDPLPGSV
ncbi:hypothetical protein L1049_013550 [Liquidambar formosana]|uniref:Uncharacterized protein n=1 Tax=Liquidambar formosana TaxID=63359 RepID=A0AAP0RKQ5_LIQFO